MVVTMPKISKMKSINDKLVYFIISFDIVMVIVFFKYIILGDIFMNEYK